MSGPSPDDERRTHPRYPRALELTGAPSSGGATARLVASNVSLGGVYCTSDRDFQEMTRLSVRLELPGEPLELPAVVVRHKELASSSSGRRYELALLFTSVTAVERERLARYLARA